MTKGDFHQLLQRYKEGKCSIAEIQKINEWFDKISDDDLELKEWEKAQFENRIFLNMRQSLSGAKEKRKVKSPAFNILKIAAGLSIIVLVAYLLIDRKAIAPTEKLSEVQSSSELREYKNTTQNILVVELPDGSAVELQPDAGIYYSKKWNGQKREVHLVGEAFFEVVKDARKPFYVYGGKIVTKVLGTSFSVNAPEYAERIEVAVRTGTVSVYEDAIQSNPASNLTGVRGVVLTPNERVEYFVKDKHWVTSLVEKPKPLPSTIIAEEFVFSDTPMKKILGSIERNYDIDIIVENEATYLCAFTGDVSRMELYDMLEVVCKSIGATYEVKGTKILITGNGCE